ncbi:MAG: 3-hydroxyacyl-CoA dehydrogenase NAD-binding domain-containing protein [Pirellulaceae bacterium]
MSRSEHLRVERDERDIVTVTFDCPDRSVNVFEDNLLRELQVLIQDLESDASARLVVFRSGKESGFFAGADVRRIEQISSAEESESILQLGQRLFQRIELLPVPTVAVIHGICLGGGLEFALACTHRVAQDSLTTRIGLPETQLGLIPGWGGTQRLPRVVGLTAAIRMILEASQLTAVQAQRIGLIDAVLGRATFERDVATFLDGCLGGRNPTPRRSWLFRLRDGTSVGQKVVLKLAGRKIATQARHYPALRASLRAIEAGLVGGMNAGLAKEREEFCRLLFTPTCRHLLGLSLHRERARKRNTWVADGVATGPPIKSIAVLGAGTMGAGIAQLAATRGYSVVMKDVDESSVSQGMGRIEELTRQAVKKEVLMASDAEKTLRAITPTTEIEPLEHVDLVIEAIVERMDVKQQVFRELDRHLATPALLTSNTSALPISQLAAVTRRADRVAGLHFFNPVHKMPLVEIVRTRHTSDQTIASLVDVVRRLGKTPLVVAEGPGFLVNRILFPYLDEAMRMVHEGLSVDQIDREAKRFGLPMGPLELLDSVGLDVALDVAQTLVPLRLDESPVLDLLTDMVSAGNKGRKTERGFYKYRHGRRGKPVKRLSVPSSATTLPPPRDIAGERVSGIQQRLVFSLINAAANCLRDGIVTEPWMVDLAMVLGTGFAPFRGGPLKLVETWGKEQVVDILQQLSDRCGSRFLPSDYFETTKSSSLPTSAHIGHMARAPETEPGPLGKSFAQSSGPSRERT